jgi:hypothetical protein
MHYAIWFNGNNWEIQPFMEIIDAATFAEGFADTGYTIFLTNEAGRELLIDKEVIFL